MPDPRSPDPRDPARPNHDPALGRPYGDPAADPRLANQTVVTSSSGRGGLIAAAVIAVLLVIALIAFTAGPTTDPGTTAVIPEQPAEETQAAPEPDTMPETAPAEPEAAPAEPSTEPLEEAPAANQ